MPYAVSESRIGRGARAAIFVALNASSIVVCAYKYNIKI